MTSKPLSQLIAELEALNAQATPGPWTFDAHLAEITAGPGRYVIESDGGVYGVPGQNDANLAFIAAFRSAWPEIVSGVEELEHALSVMTQCHKIVCDDNQMRAHEYAELSVKRYRLIDRIAKLEKVAERAKAFIQLVQWDGAFNVTSGHGQRNVCIACGKLESLHTDPCLVTDLLSALSTGDESK